MKVTVLMSVYNGERYIRQAIESILRQTFTDFEFTIVDDASTDGTPAILDSLSDTRIVRLKNESNLGLTTSLNRGLKVAHGELIARMDADDISLPQRLEKQVDYLDKHPDVGILGSTCQLIDASGQGQGMKPRLPNDTLIRWSSLLRNPFIHPTVMIRRNVLVENNLFYDENFKATQDYEFFTRVLKYTRGANLSEPLLLYRLHVGGISNKQRVTQLENHDTVAFRTIQEQLPGFAITFKQVSDLRSLFGGGVEPESSNDSQRIALAGLYLDLFEEFARNHSGEPGMKFLQQREASKVALSVLRPPLRSGWLRVFKRLLLLHPGLLWELLCFFPGACYRRLRRYKAVDSYV
jgi:glycosyltransferase involved in cell wall biosynthesis